MARAFHACAIERPAAWPAFAEQDIQPPTRNQPPPISAVVAMAQWWGESWWTGGYDTNAWDWADWDWKHATAPSDL
eukprot:11185168-Lingulodinium_polyedra.AAC.1